MARNINIILIIGQDHLAITEADQEADLQGEYVLYKYSKTDQAININIGVLDAGDPGPIQMKESMVHIQGLTPEIENTSLQALSVNGVKTGAGK
jgi:hypothetical protein